MRYQPGADHESGLHSLQLRHSVFPILGLLQLPVAAPVLMLLPPAALDWHQI